jgi:hypothetical protein
MNKEQKVNYVKCWLQKFGNRDNETFNTEVVVGKTTWEISLQYNFDDDGDQCEPYDWCRSDFKHLRNNQISDRTDEELDEIINQLKSKRFFY